MDAKRALVTGASEGIGREFAIKLAEKGYQLTLVARNEERLKSLAAALPGQGHRVLVADLASDAKTSTVAKELQQTKYSLLVNNAGFGAYGDLSDSEQLKLLQMVQVNCASLLALMHAFLSTAQSGDAVMNVSSTASFVPLPKNAAYAATKAFVTSLTLGAWHEQKEKGVFVCALCPGYTMTEFHARAGGKGKKTAMYGMSAKDVVDYALRGLALRRNPILVPGLLNKVVAEVLPRALPRTALANLVASATAEYYSST